MPPADNNAPVPAPAPEKKPGFFARLFGKKEAAPVVPAHESQTPPPQLEDTAAPAAVVPESPVAPTASVSPEASPAVPPAPVSPGAYGEGTPATAADPTTTPAAPAPADPLTGPAVPPAEEEPKTTPPTTPAV